ncbi:hypothetical protein [Planococcus rifietoensis]|uniref:hypothetical protein n=1 Tax=Planococcus rifietoensis TaxID=200991 RepID=UPI00384CDC57
MSEIQRDSETEKFIDTLEYADIYRFMRSEYDRLTNGGDDYDVEVHDAAVAESASKKFDITEEKAGNIYVDCEFKISEF